MTGIDTLTLDGLSINNVEQRIGLQLEEASDVICCISLPKDQITWNGTTAKVLHI
jgi:hypothetical protein